MKTINSIINKLCQNKEVINILLLDEIIPSWMADSTRDTFDMKGLDLSKSNVHLLLAVNPVPEYSLFNKKIKILPPMNENILACQLLMKHRNGYLIAIFLEHFKIFCNSVCLDSSQDIQLKKDNLAPGRCPVWIEKDKSLTDETVLEKIKRDYVLEHESVTVLYSCSYSLNISKWCSQNNWKCIDNSEFYGCEDQVIVTFDIDILGLEEISRAKNGLIIVTTKR